MKKVHPAVAGLLQAIGVAFYCALVSLGLFFSEHQTGPGFLTGIIMLMLLVFSAAITGSAVFGYPAYLVLNKRIKEALMVLGFTFLGFIILITLGLAIALLF